MGPSDKQQKHFVNPNQARTHDYFNILTLPVICFVNIYHICTLYAAPEDMAPPALTAVSLPRTSNDLSWTLLWYVIPVYLCMCEHM